MDRRTWISRIGILTLGVVAFRPTETVRAEEKTASPQSDAIALVIKKQQKEIAQAELVYFKENGVDWWRGEIEQYRWHDTITRSWSATRPVAPGVVDSTHWFQVTYSISDKIVASWSVDIRKKKATLSEAKRYKDQNAHQITCVCAGGSAIACGARGDNFSYTWSLSGTWSPSPPRTGACETCETDAACFTRSIRSRILTTHSASGCMRS
jgi:hypothetical protein